MLRNALAALLLGGLAGAAGAQPMRTTEGVRDRRYCEVFVVERELLRLDARVYNTLGLNDCPEATWRGIDTRHLAARTGAAAVVLNGPRHFVMDAIASADLATETTDMDGLPMPYVGTLELSLATARDGRRPYEVHRVARNTVFTYAAGAPVFELVDPFGAVFVMQSYAQIVDPAQTYATLPGLSARLRPPPGWQARMRRPDAPLVLRSGGQAVIVQDELQNTYQRLQ